MYNKTDEAMDNKVIIHELSKIYDDMNVVIEKLSNSSDEIDDDTISMYENINQKRLEAIKLFEQYEPTDDPIDTTNLKTLRKGIMNIVNAAKASMLKENSYDSQRGINRISLSTLIPVFRFELHHIPQLKQEIFTIQCYNLMQSFYEQQTERINTQLEKSKEATKTLNEDQTSITTLLNDYTTIEKIYKNVTVSGILTKDYKKFSLKIDNKNSILLEVENMDDSINNFIAHVNTIEEVENAKFEPNNKDINLIIDDDSVIELDELKEISESITQNLKELQETVLMLKDKKVLLDKDKENLDKVKDDFMKNGTELEMNENGGLRMQVD
ncbi:MAG: hypothetical protein J6Y29_01410 [Clostridiales bacterium]|nr:hypothetical protein [Clostridiales bacterium]